MVWITRVCRGEGGFEVEVQGLDGQRTQAPFESVDVNLALPRNGSRRLKVSIDLSKLRPFSTTEYLYGLGLHGLDAGNQVVYEADAADFKVVIPVQLLLAELLAPNVPLRKAIFRPSGLSDFFALWSRSNDEPVPRQPSERGKRFKSEQPNWTKAESSISRVEYVQCHLTASAAWASVYRRALDGRLDFSLPRARLDIVVRAHSIGERMLATELALTRIHPLEPPLEFDKGVPATVYQFRIPKVAPSHGKAAAPVAEPILKARGFVGPMTDEQWARVEGRLEAALNQQPGPGGRTRSHSLRDLVDVILLKLGTPYSWSQVPTSKALSQGASVLLPKLKRAGLWEQVMEELSAS